MVIQFMDKGSKIEVKCSKLAIFSSSIGSYNQVIMKLGKYITVSKRNSHTVQKLITQTKEKGSKVKVKYSKLVIFGARLTDILKPLKGFQCEG